MMATSVATNGQKYTFKEWPQTYDSSRHLCLTGGGVLAFGDRDDTTVCSWIRYTCLVAERIETVGLSADLTLALETLPTPELSPLGNFCHSCLVEGV